MKTLGIYGQIPFCASKCSFCNFSSRVERREAFDAYCLALEREIARLPESHEKRGISLQVCLLPVDSVYFGGGTPSLLGALRLEKIIGALHRCFKFLPQLEFTLEVTPGSADEDFLRRVSALGINRLSVGAQSFDARELASIGRLHSPAETRELVRQARLAGFKNINLDLIAGLPYQNKTTWLESLGAACEPRPEHLSIYLFEIDEKSRLGREVLAGGNRYHAAAVPDEDFMADAYERARELLAMQGYVQYEISNFALPGYESRHNRRYWRLEPYVGVGAGAHSFDGQRRWANEISMEDYEAKIERGESPISEVRTLSPVEQLEEFFFLGLRQVHGIDLAAAKERWGRERIAALQPRISALVRDGWLEKTDERVRLTERAFLVSNEIFQEFVGVPAAYSQL